MSSDHCAVPLYIVREPCSWSRICIVKILNFFYRNIFIENPKSTRALEQLQENFGMQLR